MVAGKRQAEHIDLDGQRGAHRAPLAHYSLAYLRSVRSVASGVTMTAYCLWAFEKAQTSGHAAIWFEVSIVPFVIAVLRYSLLIDGGQGGAPEDVVLGDRPLQVVGAVWLLLFALGVYAG